jgi:RNA polymerase sigma factor (sigma-70 family)
VRPIACAIARSTGADADELVGAGQLALVKAVRKFDPDLGVPLEAWVRCKVRGAMLDSVRRSMRKPSVDLRPAQKTPEQTASAEESRARAAAAVRSLRLEEATVLRLRYLEGVSDDRAALVLGTDKLEIARIRRKAIAKLRRSAHRIDGVALAGALRDLTER